MSYTPSIPGEVVENIPFAVRSDGKVHAILTLEQFNLISKYVTAHQKQMNCAAVAMAKRKTLHGHQGQVRAKLRYNLVLTNVDTETTQES